MAKSGARAMPTKARVFVGSSSEAVTKGLTPAIVEAVARAFPTLEVRPWRKVFVNGKFALDALIEEAGHCDFAILIYARDDRVKIRGKSRFVTRDNVLLESGLFLGRLGPRRVAQIIEGDTNVPTDLDGLVNIRIGYTKRAAPTQIQHITTELQKAWGNPQCAAALGLGETLQHVTRSTALYRERIVLRELQRAPALDPLVLDATPIMLAYKEALARVSHRFCATTYITSEFMNARAAEVEEANLLMAKRVVRNGANSLRRIILLDQPEERFIEDQRHQIQIWKERGELQAVNERLGHVDRCGAFINKLARSGVSIRVNHDSGDQQWRSRLAVPYRAGDTEIAIYDNRRVDLYSGGSRGAVDGVQCFLPGMPRFGDVLTGARGYFDSLWGEGVDAVKFAKKWADEVRAEASAITHTSEWRWLFDYTDNELKQGEFDVVASYLKRDRMRWKGCTYLDVGTCTGRYPLSLSQRKLIEPVEGLAIDADWGCALRAETKLKHAGISSIRATRRDLMDWDRADSEKFDLITCMLGTLSYFAASHNGAAGVGRAIRTMSRLLKRKGVLFIGSWADATKENRDFLSIYSDKTRRQLAQCTPRSRDVERLIRAAGLSFDKYTVLERLHVYVCQKVKVGRARRSPKAGPPRPRRNGAASIRPKG